MATHPVLAQGRMSSRAKTDFPVRLSPKMDRTLALAGSGCGCIVLMALGFVLWDLDRGDRGLRGP